MPQAWDRLELLLCGHQKHPLASAETSYSMTTVSCQVAFRPLLFRRVWADRVKQEEKALTQRSAELRRHLSGGGGSGGGAAAMAGGSYFGGAVKRPASREASKPAGAQQFLAERYASAKGGSSGGARGGAGGGSSARATASPAAPIAPAKPAAPSAPAAVVARGGNPLARTSNAAATELPTRTAVLQRPPEGATEGGQSGGHGAAATLALPSAPDLPQLPASSSANGSGSPLAALPSPAKDVGMQPALPQHASSSAPNGSGLGGVRGWIDGLRGYRSSGDEEGFTAPPLNAEPAPVRDDANSSGQVTPEAPLSSEASGFDGHSPAAPMVVALGMASALASVIKQVLSVTSSR